MVIGEINQSADAQINVSAIHGGRGHSRGRGRGGRNDRRHE
jgi:hypothetical protein